MVEIQSRPGMKFILQLPEGYDERVRLTTFQGKTIIAHPDFPPCYVEEGKLVEIKS